MKTKKIVIKSRDSFYADAADQLEAVFEQGKKRKVLKGTFFDSLEAVSAVLTPKRLEVWKTIRDKKPDSILALSKILKRDFKSIHTDVQLLVEVGLVGVTKSSGPRGDRQTPRSLADKFKVELEVA